MKTIDQYLNEVKKKNPNEPEFIQAVQELLESVYPYIEKNPKYFDYKIIERVTEAERIIMFRVPWVDDKGQIQVNRGYRVQFNSAIGLYKGGTRFHAEVNLSIMKFLAFEQIFKNSLTGLPMGGAKGGADFDPKGKSENEIMKFCQSYMTELYRHLGPNTDVPGGDIGVGSKELSYMFGQYKRIRNEFTGSFTGKGLNSGGSLIRTEATGYGLLYFVNEMLNRVGMKIEGQRIAISGSGNVAQYAAEKALQMGAKVLTLSDSDGFVFIKNGLTKEQLEYVKELKNIRHGRIEEFSTKYKHEYYAGKSPWRDNSYDIALPCATQNELDLEDAKALVKNKIKVVAEGANMPSTLDAIKFLIENKILFAPAKAANAGGVSVSGLEMTQNSLKLSWTREEVDEKLKEIMENIHKKALEYGTTKEGINYLDGANIAGFVKVADAMIEQGVV